MPLTDETKGMINAAAIAKMKNGVVIVNTGRGKCIVEEDLADGAEVRQGRGLRHRRLVLAIRPIRPARCSRRRTSS